MDRSYRSGPVVAMLAVGLLGAVGCGANGPRTYPVNGKVELPQGDVSQLAGSTIEAVSEANETVRASGEIQADGSFTLETLHDGVVRKGAQGGAYRVRIILNDEDGPSRKRAKRAIAPRFLKFQTSGLSFQVPASGEVKLEVSPR